MYWIERSTRSASTTLEKLLMETTPQDHQISETAKGCLEAAQFSNLVRAQRSTAYMVETIQMQMLVTLDVYHQMVREKIKNGEPIPNICMPSAE
jgi:hypothetical protein